MMRKLLITLLALLLCLNGVPGTAFAQSATYLPVMQRGLLSGPNVADQFADRLMAAVARDPSGNAPIEGGIGGYSPRMVYEAMRTFHPETGLTSLNPGREDYEALAEYWRTLQVVRTTEPKTLRNTRMIRRGSTYVHDLGWSHTLPAGTLVLVDRNTGQEIAKIDCGNILGPVGPVPPPPDDCPIYVIVPIQASGSRLSVQLASTTYVDTPDCPVSIAGPGTGDLPGGHGRTFDPAGYRPLWEDGANPCDWTAVIAYGGQPATPIRGCMSLGRGWYAIKLDRSFLDNPNNILWICERLPDGRVSLSVDVRPHEFARNASGTWIATVWPSEALTPAEYRWTMDWIEWDLSRSEELMGESRQWLTLAGIG